MKIIKPKKLQKGDAVGIISPSKPIAKKLYRQFDVAVAALQEFGLKVKFGEHIFDQYFYSAGTRETRIKDFNKIWQDPEVKMILMSQGGQTANHLLDGIDYEMIKRRPKIFAGISDGTTLLNAIFSKTGLVTYHGPDFEDAILFLEGTDDIAHLDRQFTALKLNGVFGKISGLIIGWFEDHEMKDKDTDREVPDVILEVTKNYSFPILEIGELGHNVENYILPIGCTATIDADNKYFSIDEPAVL
ncbi:LD-carboxypeptidase [Candidatus Roizmanbacteria bacterium]|nr:LD-carboxypeptidase [Candidatus Roizmanbacteria bacterium]